MNTRYETIGQSRGKTGTLRRILAAGCIICVALLQCAAFAPVVTELAYAKEGGLKVSAGNDKLGQDTTFKDDFDGSVKELLKELGITESDVKSIDSDLGELSKDDKIRRDGDEYFLVTTVTVPKDPEDPDAGEEEQEDLQPITDISFTMKSGYTPIKSLYINDLNNMKSGDKVTLKYGSDYGVKDGDKFFKDQFPNLIDVSTSGASEESIDAESVSFKAGKAGTKVTVTVKDAITGKPSVSKNASVVSKTLTVSPSSLKLTVGRSSSVTVKDDNGTLSNSSLKWKSSDSKVAAVEKGVITGKKKGKATITVTDNTSGLSAKVTVTVSEAATYSYTRTTRSYPTYRATRSTYRATRSTTGTGITRPTTATRPTDSSNPSDPSAATATPSFQTMKVKEVYLNPVAQDPYDDEYDDPEDPWDDGEDWDDEDWDEEDWDEDGVTFPAAAGSAAVAAAACGAGAVGRIRRFRHDMGDLAAAAGSIAEAEDTPETSANTPEEPKAQDESPKKKLRNPLKKFRK